MRHTVAAGVRDRIGVSAELCCVTAIVAAVFAAIVDGKAEAGT